jgi:hypothetical protein
VPPARGGSAARSRPAGRPDDAAVSLRITSGESRGDRARPGQGSRHMPLATVDHLEVVTRDQRLMGPEAGAQKPLSARARHAFPEQLDGARVAKPPELQA